MVSPEPYRLRPSTVFRQAVSLIFSAETQESPRWKGTEAAMAHTVFHTCSLCEATCGLRFEVEDNRILSVRPDEDDVFSKGYVCPKGIAIADIHHDPDRLRRPVRRNGAGEFEEISWDEAFDLVGGRLGEIRKRHGSHAIGFYWGNPTGNNHGALLMLSSFTKAIGTRNRFSAGSQDANPRIVTSYELYGSSIALPIPDIDRTAYFLCLGGNPMISNGSVMTAPDMRRRLRAVRERGGKVVVVDPRRTETAKEANEHVAIRPGGDAAFLLAMAQVLVERGRVDRRFLESTTSGWPEVERRLAAFTPARVAAFAGVAAGTIERLALEFADARSAVCYSRVGVCVGAHGTVATFATDLLNIITGRLGREGGPMFTTPAFDIGRVARMSGLDGHHRWQSRVRGLPETLGDLPSTVLADEIETPGPGQIRAMVTLAGNPVLSVPNGKRIAAAFDKLDFMVSIDIYINETTRHAHVILPPCWNLAEDHIDLLFNAIAVRNIARWSPPVVQRGEGELADWEILLELTERLGGGPTGEPWLDRLLRWLRPLGVRWTPTGFLDLILRLGPHGDRFLPWRDGLNLEKLKAAPHGIDLGALQPGVERRLYHRDKRIHLDSPLMLEAMAALERNLDAKAGEDGLVLIGRRELRSNNSWMHNVPSLVSGRERCVLYVHPDDAARYEVRDGELAILESRVHRGEVRVAVTDDVRPGVVSLPHGWGHADSAPWQKVAGSHAGVSVNDWVDDSVVEPIIGQSILNGVPVRLEPQHRGA
jgi:anaerobic selenocysteine-containing dehydrogenase